MFHSNFTTMKNFKRSGSILIFGIVLISFLSCDKELPIQPDRERVPVNGQIMADHVSFFINDRDDPNVEESFL